MFPGMNPKKMQGMMKQLGIAQEEINANRVIIETDDKNIIIENPSVIKIKMQGQENFQISGDVLESKPSTPQESEEPEEDRSQEDIKTIIEKTGINEEQAREALEKAEGDLTEALISLG